MYKKIIIVVGVVLVLFTSCKKEKEINVDYQNKYTYVEKNLPSLLKNLNKAEVDSFISIMKLNENGILTSYDFDLLERGSKDDFKKYMIKISEDLEGNSDYIVSIDELGKERVIVNNYFKDINDKEFPLSEIKKWDGLFLILSLRCGHCLESFRTMNALSASNKNSKIKFISLFPQSSIVLQNYKNGSAYLNFGFLNQQWTTFFDSKNLIEEFLPDYSEEKDGFPYLFYRKNGVTIKVPIDKNSFKIDNIISELENL